MLLAPSARAQSAPEGAPSPSQEVEATSLAARLAAAERAYAELRLDEAGAAIRLLLEELAGDDARATTSERVRAHVLAASIARARGDLAGCDAALDAALALDPALRLDPALHPPPLLEALERRRAAIVAATPVVPVEPTRTAVPVQSTPGPSAALSLGLGRVEPSLADPSPADPWPWVGLGVGGAVVVGGAIVLAVVLATPPSSFDIRGTIAP